MTSKQRAALRAQANELRAIIQIGKQDIGDNLISQVDGAL
ncbi:MAG: YhbY family RNA-binding protein, partial [Oscillospiraceae bacterium]|nr:YhbY family RNA-binding protein [Oscillospiraceae bacterium]